MIEQIPPEMFYYEIHFASRLVTFLVTFEMVLYLAYQRSKSPGKGRVFLNVLIIFIFEMFLLQSLFLIEILFFPSGTGQVQVLGDIRMASGLLASIIMINLSRHLARQHAIKGRALKIAMGIFTVFLGTGVLSIIGVGWARPFLTVSSTVAFAAIFIYMVVLFRHLARKAAKEHKVFITAIIVGISAFVIVNGLAHGIVDTFFATTEFYPFSARKPRPLAVSGELKH